jgi:hypothetical protein
MQSLLPRWQMMLSYGLQLGCLAFGGSGLVIDDDRRRLGGNPNVAATEANLLF